MRIELVIVNACETFEKSFSHSVSVHFYYLIIKRGARVQSWLENNTFGEWEPIKVGKRILEQCLMLMLVWS